MGGRKRGTYVLVELEAVLEEEVVKLLESCRGGVSRVRCAGCEESETRDAQYSFPSRSKNSTRSRLIVGMLRPEMRWGKFRERDAGAAVARGER